MSKIKLEGFLFSNIPAQLLLTVMVFFSPDFLMLYL